MRMHDRLDRLVGADLPQRLDHRFGADDLGAVLAALAGADHAHRVEERDALALVETERLRRDAPVIVLRQVLRRPFRQAHLVVEFILIGHIVDQSGPDGVFGQERTVIDQRADFGVGLVPALREPADHLVVEAAIE